MNEKKRAITISLKSESIKELDCAIQKISLFRVNRSHLIEKLLLRFIDETKTMSREEVVKQLL